jgi:hypothetical protein
MKRLTGPQLFDVVVLIVGLVGSFVLMSVHHPYTSTILSMLAAIIVAVHIGTVALRTESV